jgi:flagellar biogenesis protein FliO
MLRLARRAAGGCSAAMMAWACDAPAALAGQLGQAPDTDVPWWRIVGALVLCLGMAVGAAYVLRERLGGAAPKLRLLGGGRRMRLVEALRLSHQVDICLLQCDDEELMLAASAQGVTLIKRTEKGSAPSVSSVIKIASVQPNAGETPKRVRKPRKEQAA